MYSYGSSNAHKLDYSELSYNNYNNIHTKKQKQTLNKKPEVKAKSHRLSATLRSFFLVSVCFLTAFFIVRGYVAIYESENKIVSLQKELKEVEAENQAIKAKIDKSIDLKNLQTLASEKFGMVKPENYQIFYVDLEFDDYSENVSRKQNEKERKDVPVEGVAGVFISAADMFR